MAAPSESSTLENGAGGLPLVREMGLNTNKAVNFSGFQVDTSGNMTSPSTATAVSTFNGTVTGPTGSFAVLQITSANASGATGTTAALGPTGALDGGPTTAAQNGWAVLYVAGVKCWVPVWV